MIGFEDLRLPPIDHIAPGRRRPISEREVAEISIMSDNGLHDYERALHCAITPNSGLVLDIGTGRNARFLRDARKENVTAVGIAPFQTLDGKPTLPVTMPQNKRPRLVQATASALPFADEQFETCVSLHAISYICPYIEPEARTAIYDELLRVLRPGGTAYIGRFTPQELEVAIPLIEPLRKRGVTVKSYKGQKWVNRRTYENRYSIHLHKQEQSADVRVL